MTRPSPWPERDAEMRELFAAGNGTVRVAEAMGLRLGQVAGRSRILRIHLEGARGDPKPLRADHPVLVTGNTLFRSRVFSPGDSETILKPGDNQRKLGGVVEKGTWRGLPIFSLTLEERATCPRSCGQWRWCMGNAMHLAKRFRHGDELERALEHELTALNRDHPSGFVVRLHILGDFYSLAYARLWRRWLDRLPALHVFGYTAWQPATPIGAALRRLAMTRWDRFAVRLSCDHVGARRAIVVDTREEARSRGAIVCPVQTGATQCCGTCGLCWAPAAQDKTIAFIRHGMAGGRRRATAAARGAAPSGEQARA